MCEQCSAECVTIAEIVDGWYLYQAKKDGNFMKAGEYALGCGDNPTFYFKTTPLPEPLADDDELRDITKEEKEQLNRFDEAVEGVRTSLVCDPPTGYYFYQACLNSGYDPDIHGPCLDYWLTNAIGIAIRAFKNHH